MRQGEAQARGPLSISRRSLLLAAGGSAVGCAADAWLLEPRWIAVERIDFVIPDLGPAWQGATVALLSDTHCGPLHPPAFIERAVSITNELAPDVVLLLGDYVHRGVQYLEPGVEPFAKLRARHGVYAVLGNHDHWAGRDRALAAFRRVAVPVLTNRSTVLHHRGECFAVGGVGDFLEDKQRPEVAFRGVRPNTPRMLMSHNPDYAEHLPEGVRVDLMVSGHTHGGQVYIPGYGAPVLPSRYGKKYQRGLVQGPRCPVYVTRGIGTITPRVRFFCRPEVTLISLRGEGASPPLTARRPSGTSTT
jgi:predicted MPP superfamily phosphohydrolase